jgi:hypothetical protein
MRPFGRKLAMLCLVAFAVVVSGCLGTQRDDTLARQIAGLSNSGRTVALKSMTDFDWDTVYLFPGYAHEADVNRTAGGHVMADDVYLGEVNLLVFDLHGTPVVQVELDGEYFGNADATTWPADVNVVATACGLQMAGPETPVVEPTADLSSGCLYVGS